MKTSVIKVEPYSFEIQTENPFIITMHHKDHYPKGTENDEIDVDFTGRNKGSDFSGKDGFSMYHGIKVPGFPVHPHRGFETVTVVLEGLIDHSDSLGTSGRYGFGDVQWMTAGKGCQHSEMFSLANHDNDNPLELFQIWLNLPSYKKFVEPDYKMLWHEEIPKFEVSDEAGKKTMVTLIAGEFDDYKSLKPAKDSWAADPDNHVGIILFKLEPNAKLTLPERSKTMNRNLYLYRGDKGIQIEDQWIHPKSQIKLVPEDSVVINNGEDEAYLLLLEGEPINENVVQYGPFVMNSMDEVQTAYRDYQVNQFGGWPWNRPDPIHNKTGKRFAKYVDGRIEVKED